MMARVKIKSKDTPSKERKLKLLEILCSNEVQVTKVFTTTDEFAILLLNEDNADTIFTKKVKSELAANDFQPLLPPELKVKKSVLVTRLDDLVYERDEEAIVDELIKHNTWIGDDIDTIYKFPNSQTIKITFTQTATAKKCTEKGLLAFNISIAPHTIKQETYISIRCCMKCYCLEEHTTRECPKPKDYKICSECSSIGHLWHQCKEEQKKCINCEGNHSTLAMRCTKRKEIMRKR